MMFNVGSLSNFSSSFVQAYVTVDGVPLDILIDGLSAQNRAVCFCNTLTFLSGTFAALSCEGTDAYICVFRFLNMTLYRYVY